MYFTLSLIANLLNKYNPLYDNSIDEEKKFKQIEVISGKGSIKYNDNTLYIITRPNPTSFFEHSTEKHFFLCCGNRDFFKTCSILKCNCIVLPENTEMSVVINEIMNMISSLWEWNMDMERIISNDEGLQALIDCSEKFFHDPIIVMSKILHVLAYTKNIPATHPDINQTLQDGFFPKHMIQGLIENNYLQEAEHYHEIGYHYPPNYINCTKIIKVFSDNIYNIHTICLYGLSQVPNSEAMYYMRVLVSFIERMIQKAGKPLEKIDGGNSYIFADILDGNLSDKEIDSKMALIKWKRDSLYRIFCVKFRHYYFPYVQYTFNCIQSNPNFTGCFIYKEKIVFFQQMSVDDSSDDDLPIEELKAILSENNAYCGVSEEISMLTSLREAYTQAYVAGDFGNCIHKNDVVHKYRNYYAYHLLQLCGKETSIQNLYYKGLDKLINIDRKYGTNNIEILRSVLENERNITSIAYEMNMHRNSILYRIKKIESILKVSLDDPEIRLMLQFSLKILDMEQMEKKELAMSM